MLSTVWVVVGQSVGETVAGKVCSVSDSRPVEEAVNQLGWFVAIDLLRRWSTS